VASSVFFPINMAGLPLLTVSQTNEGFFFQNRYLPHIKHATKSMRQLYRGGTPVKDERITLGSINLYQ